MKLSSREQRKAWLIKNKPLWQGQHPAVVSFKLYELMVKDNLLKEDSSYKDRIWGVEKLLNEIIEEAISLRP